MRNVLRNTEEVAHIWAQQTQPSGRGGNVFFEAKTLYSFGHHFVTAKFVTAPSGEKCVLLNSHTYSATTSKHQRQALDALRNNLVPIFHVKFPERFPIGHGYSLEDCLQTEKRDFQNNIDLLLEKASKARERKESYLSRAIVLSNHFNSLAEFFGSRLTIEIDSVTVEQYYVVNAARLAAEKAEKKARAVAIAAEAETHSEFLNAWRARDVEALQRISEESAAPRLHYAYLRVKDDEIETTQRAYVPITHAKLLWPTIRDAHATGIAPGRVNKRIGHYTLNEIKSNGDIVIGCHDIQFAEVRRMAVTLGLAS